MVICMLLCEKRFEYNNIDKAKIKLQLLPPLERYALMEDRIEAYHCPNCDVELKFLKGKTKLTYKCPNCCFTLDGF
jgi:hypothetical protein